MVLCRWLQKPYKSMCKLGGRDHNATSYSTETSSAVLLLMRLGAEIITLRAIALKQRIKQLHKLTSFPAEIITLRAIALKLDGKATRVFTGGRAEIITLRAIALKRRTLRRSSAVRSLQRS